LSSEYAEIFIYSYCGYSKAKILDSKWGVEFEAIYWFIFHPIFMLFQNGDGGQAGGDIWVYIEFIVARLPTLQILGEKKVAKIPEQTHSRLQITHALIKISGFTINHYRLSCRYEHPAGFYTSSIHPIDL